MKVSAGTPGRAQKSHSRGGAGGRMEDILANGLPIIAMWTAKYGEGGFYVLTSADCGPALYMDMGKAGAARFVKPKTNVNLTGFSLDECRFFTLGHVYIMEGVTPWVRTHGAQPANNMLLTSSLRSETEEKLLRLTERLEQRLASMNSPLSPEHRAKGAGWLLWRVAILGFGAWLGAYILRVSM